ncbi:MAG: 23S rRNA (adenine(2503)-C(2))-methyltransferase RlmN [Deltaproteobacteria bacterium]|jgi:23S rRNA (adenine2503-C2)-methyltransferase|nr:23S rRNA (adenine(2503)-C(2))-methyltransferase RlmN [Deltaproteobacteria bacterium]
MKITDLSEDDLIKWVGNKGHKSFRGKQLFQWLYLHKVEDINQMNNLPKKFREEITNHFSLNRIEIIKQEIAKDGTIKIAQKLADDYQIESVLMNHDDHYTLCISTQVGCAMACKFCLTAQMGFKRNLSPGEIIDQLLNAYQFIPADKRIRNIVYMGMGEPFNNYDNTIKSLEIFLNPSGLNFSSRRITVSTSGVIPGIIRFGQEKEVKTNLAISLNGVTQESRKKLMPISKRYQLEDLIAACRDFPTESRKRITFEYILMDGLTDSIASAKQLVKLLHGTKSKVNLIPYNENEALDFKSSSENSIKAFQQYLIDHGLIVTLRRSKGQGISAACGQLATQKKG